MEGGEGFNLNSGNIENKVVVDWKQRELDKKEELRKRYAGLDDKGKGVFIESQQEVVGLFGKLVSSDQDVSSLLPEEQVLIDKTRNFVKRQKELRPGDPVNVTGFSKEEDRLVYENLIRRWAMSRTVDHDSKSANVLKINENHEFKAKNIDPKKIVMGQEGDKVVIKYNGNDWYSIDGELLVEDNLKVILNKGKNAPYASFEPIGDVYTINAEAVHDLSNDKDSFLTAMAHEIGHDNYLSLSEEQQRDLNNLFMNDPQMRQNFMDFIQALYGDKYKDNDNGPTAGEAYLGVHNVNVSDDRKDLLVLEGQKGLKDKRSIEIQINGQKKEVFIGAAITEFLSYMSAYEINETAFDKAVSKANSRRNGIDQRFEVIRRTKEYVDKNKDFREKLDGFKIFDKEKLKKIYNLVSIKDRDFLLVDE